MYHACMYTEFAAPIYGTRDGLPVIVVGALTSPTIPEEMWFICVDGDGGISKAKMNEIKADVRFQDDAWHDVSPGPETPEE